MFAIVEGSVLIFGAKTHVRALTGPLWTDQSTSDNRPIFGRRKVKLSKYPVNEIPPPHPPNSTPQVNFQSHSKMVLPCM